MIVQPTQIKIIKGKEFQGKGLNEQELKRLQHELKIYMEKYFKHTLGKGVDATKINIVDDMLIIRGEGFLTDPEKFIVTTSEGSDTVRAFRMCVVRQHIIDNIPYFEKLFDAEAIHHTYEVEVHNDFWIHVIVFNRVLTL